jgi:hypothetical protein
VLALVLSNAVGGWVEGWGLEELWSTEGTATLAPSHHQGHPGQAGGWHSLALVQSEVHMCQQYAQGFRGYRVTQKLRSSAFIGVYM